MTVVRPELPGEAVRHLGRALGADDDAVRREWLGVPAARLAWLRAAGVVRQRAQ